MAYSKMDVLMKEYEHKYRRKLDPTDYVMIRLDGRAFHTFTRGMRRPYDLNLMMAMGRTTEELCKQIQGVRVAYTQSDEISLLITAWKDEEADQSKLDLAFGGVEAKLLSLSASIAAVEFNDASKDLNLSDKKAHFDSRVWTFPGTPEGLRLVEQYFNWRRADAERNSVSMAAQAHFSHKQLHKKSTKDMMEMLRDIDEDWEHMNQFFKFGSLISKSSYSEEVVYINKSTGLTETAQAIRSRWDHRPATGELDSSTLFAPKPLKESA